MKMHARALSAVLVAVMIAFGFAFAPVLTTAQDAATPLAFGAQDHPAHIHNGTCDDLGDPAFPLDNVTNAADLMTPEAMESTPPFTEIAEDSVEGNVAESSTTVDASIDDLLADDHAFNIHLSPDQASVFIACGDISGKVENGSLDIELAAVDDSRYSGHAVLTDNGDGTTTVVVSILQESASATPAATPAS